MRIRITVWIICLAVSGALQAQPGKVAKVYAENMELRNGVAYVKNKPFTGISYKLWENKVVNEETHWTDGLKDGEYKEFTEENILVARENWSQGVKHGEFSYYYPNGAVKNSGTFFNGILDGEIRGYYPNGNPQYLNTYKMGIRHGKSHTWFSNGRTEQTAFFVNDIPDGEVLAWYPDSTPRYQTEYKMGIKHGRYYRWHKTGCPAEESYFKNGKQDSIRRLYDEINCSLLAEESYLNGEKHGAFIRYGFKGDTVSIENFKFNKPDGRYAVWQARTTWEYDAKSDRKFPVQERGLESSGMYVEGQPDGYWKYGMISRYQMREGAYDKGVMVGMWKFYDANGDLLARQWYNEEGEVIKSKFVKKKKQK